MHSIKGPNVGGIEQVRTIQLN